MSLESISREDFVLWKESIVTKEIINHFKGMRQNYSDKITSGGTLESLTETSRIVGVIEGLDFLLNASYEEVNDE